MYAKENPKDPFHYLPTYAYIGDFQDAKMHGTGTLFKKVPFGLVKYFVGTFEDNEPKEGKILYPSQVTKFHGLLQNEKFSRGTLYAEDGTIQWTGCFENDLPHGSGSGKYKQWSFQGMMDHGNPTFGRLSTNQNLFYHGHLDSGLFHGLGQSPTEIGDFEKGVLVFGSSTAQRRNFVDGIPIMRYVGPFRDGTWHGPGALFFKMFDLDEDTLLKFVGTFDRGRRHGSFSVYKTTEDDPLLNPPGTRQGPCLKTSPPFSTTPLTYGTCIGTADFTHNVHTGDITLLDDDVLTYRGSGRLFFEGHVLVKHGIGTQYVKGYPRYSGVFDSHILVYVSTLFDENGLLLFEQNDVPTYAPIEFLDEAREWPKLSGRGKVYGVNGYLYTGSFQDGYLLNAEALLRELPAIDFVVQEQCVDYITYETIPRGEDCLAILINNITEHQKPLLVSTFLTLCQGVLKDPIRGGYPGIRFQKILMK